MFSGGERWATNEPARDRSGVCKSYETEVKGLHRLWFDIDYVEVYFNPNIDKLPDCAVLLFSANSIGPISFLDKISCFHVAWGLLTMRWYIVK